MRQRVQHEIGNKQEGGEQEHKCELMRMTLTGRGGADALYKFTRLGEDIPTVEPRRKRPR